MICFVYNENGPRAIDVSNISPEHVDYFIRNNIKVSIENLANQIIVYGCPYDDETEESEVIVFAGKKDCFETMAELVKSCKAAFGDKSADVPSV
jgi:hypothetical protein